MRICPPAILALIGLATLLTAACSPGGPAPQPRVAAKVNGEDISVPRVQLLLSRRSAEPAREGDAAAMMEGLVDRVLFAQKAAKLELDRRGIVPIAIDEARTDILAQAYIEKMLEREHADAAAIKAFYAENRAFFDKRRIFRLFELSVGAPAERLPAIRARAERARSLAEVAGWLKSQGLAYNVGGTTKPSEQVPMPLLEVLNGMRNGEIRVVPLPAGASLVQLVQSDPAPLSLEEAEPMVHAMLRARKRAEIAERERKYLRSVASIEYVVDFGSGAPRDTPE